MLLDAARQTNGHLEDEIGKVQPSQSYPQPPQLFWNAGREHRGAFVEVEPASADDLGEPLVGRAAAYADFEADGDLDIVLTQPGGPARLLRNDQELDHHWLRVTWPDGSVQDVAVAGIDREIIVRMEP